MSIELGEVGTEFLFQNEHVKTWSLVLEPGNPARGTGIRCTTCSSSRRPAG